MLIDIYCPSTNIKFQTDSSVCFVITDI